MLDPTIIITIAGTLTAVGVIWAFGKKMFNFISRHIGKSAIAQLQAKDFNDTPYLGEVIKRQDTLEGDMKLGFDKLGKQMERLYEMEKEDRLERYSDNMHDEDLPISRRFAAGERYLELGGNGKHKLYFNSVLKPLYEKNIKKVSPNTD